MLNGERDRLVGMRACSMESAQSNGWLMGLVLAGVLAILVRMLVSV